MTFLYSDFNGKGQNKIENKMSHLEKYTYIYIHFILICRYMYQLTSDDSTMTVMWQYWITVIFPYVCLLYGLKRESPTPTHTQHSSFFSQPSPHRWPCGIPLPLELLLLLGIFNPKGKKYAHLLFTVKSRSYLPITLLQLQPKIWNIFLPSDSYHLGPIVLWAVKIC